MPADTSMRTLRITRGLDLPIAGVPVQIIEEAPPVSSVALLGDDYVGMRFTMLVEPSERVKLGQPLFSDKKTPGVVFTSPGGGTVAAVNRGLKRAFLSVVIDLDDADPHDCHELFPTAAASRLQSLDRQAVVDVLVRSGVWTSFRERPFSRIPSPDTTPHSIFVTATDTNPLAADPAVIIAARAEDFLLGLTAITRLEAGKIFLCKSPAAELPQPIPAGIETAEFAGPHPAGLPGTHIHMLDPVGRQKTVWHIGYQDVIAVGHLFRTGRPDVSCIIALAGPAVARPRLVQTRLGANLAELTAEQLIPCATAGSSSSASQDHDVRIISGSVLSGRDAATMPENAVMTAASNLPATSWANRSGANPLGFLGRYHLQVSAVSDRPQRELFGWIMPGFHKFSLINVVASKLLGRGSFAMDTSLHGGRRAIVPIGTYERVMPLDILPTFLLRALASNDIEQAEALGCLELDEDDLALCTFVDPGKQDFGCMLRRMLATIEKEG